MTDTLDTIMRAQGATLARDLATSKTRHFYFPSAAALDAFADARPYLPLPCAVGVQGETAEKGRHYACAYLDQAPIRATDPAQDHTALLRVAEAVLTKAGKFIVSAYGSPLEVSRSKRPLIRRLRWARRIVRAAIVGGASWQDVEDALKAGCRVPENNDCEFGWAAFHACMGARTVLGLTGYVD